MVQPGRLALLRRGPASGRACQTRKALDRWGVAVPLAAPSATIRGSPCCPEHSFPGDGPALARFLHFFPEILTLRDPGSRIVLQKTIAQVVCACRGALSALAWAHWRFQGH